MGDFQVLEVAAWSQFKELSVVVCRAFIPVKTSSSLRYIKLPTHNVSMAIADEVVVSQERYALFCASYCYYIALRTHAEGKIASPGSWQSLQDHASTCCALPVPNKRNPQSTITPMSC